jgi:hypothetical protein
MPVLSAGFFTAQLIAFGDPLHETETFRRSPIAPSAQLRQTQRQIPASVAQKSGALKSGWHVRVF